jgi:DNA-binding CsgD family transcriptional regulator
MNTALALAPRSLATHRVAPSRRPPAARVDREEQAVRTNELVVLLLDALVRTFRFSDRERAVLGHVLCNRSSLVIARLMGIRETTVHKLMHSIFARTATEDRRRLFDLALRLAAQQCIVAPRRLAVVA